jgi:hypothetical protein
MSAQRREQKGLKRSSVGLPQIGQARIFCADTGFSGVPVTA